MGDPIYLGTLLRLFAQHVPDFMDLILSSKHTVTKGEKTSVEERGVLKSAWGTHIEPLGFDRFKTCELMAELLHCSNMGLLNEPGSEEIIKKRDAERERLREQGAFLSNKQSEDSAVDISVSSSRFENAFTPSASTSTEELRIANLGDEDGFEKVAVSDATEAPRSSEQAADAKTTQDPTSPAENLDDTVRRLSLESAEDTIMTTPPNESETSTPEQQTAHPEDKPAPLFSSDPNKTPTANSPEPTTSPKVAKEVGQSSHVEGDSFQTAQDETMHNPPSEGAADPPVVGDHLKLMFVENKVVPTILSFFFRFPWNNFLHNVVYDVVQQVFNGPMDRGFNRSLAIDLFETGDITMRIVDGQKKSDEAQEKSKMRLGYMGHLTLIAEEVVKFTERHPPELLSDSVLDKVMNGEWVTYVEVTLAETRERDNAILGGVRPDMSVGPRQAVMNAVNAATNFGGASSALADAGLNGSAGLDSIDLANGNGTSAFTLSGGTLLSGFGSSSDEEDDEMDEDNDDDGARNNSGAAEFSRYISTPS